MTRILVCGTRFDTRERPELADRVRGMIRAYLELYGPDLTVVHGAARGVDICAGQVAREADGWTEELWPVSRGDYRSAPVRGPMSGAFFVGALTGFPVLALWLVATVVWLGYNFARGWRP